jgi:DNA-directed RNA polymerase sigma subunit (sigma70/sigma32)
MSEAPSIAPSAAIDPATAEDLTVIREQTREILELVRNLVGLLLPKDDGEGPKLEDLIAALIAQQRDILVSTRQIQSDIQALLKKDGQELGDSREPGEINGGARL